MKEIKLTRGQVAIVDDDDFERINALRWYAEWHSDTKTFYATRTLPRDNNGRRAQLYMHRAILCAESHMQVDHVNHDTLDNRKENLRICTGSQNQANKRKQSNNTSGFKGVSWDKRRCKWLAQISVNTKHRNLGRYSDIADAILAYDRAAAEANGEFAVTNKKLGLL